ncbi:Synaptotagmin-3 [Apostasia shenzhenica]|uniref:Synaptotagmin-3 n=1 Tax=Apostasia shenzhenica TaxID=1088818 RepID=A0A2I0A5Y5_9ASPA|nr:Synaptotagmin-3 [Apostasia shenzhenica]
MTTPAPAPPPTVRKLVVEVVDARDLVPKDGQGTSSPYVVVDFAGQRKRTQTRPRDLNPQWHERLEFVVSDPTAMELEELDVEVYNDKRLAVSAGGGGAAARKNHFLGRVRVYGSQFVRRGVEGLVYFPLEKRSILSWIRGEIGLKIYYFDDHQDQGKKPETTSGESHPPSASETVAPLPEAPREVPEIPAPTETAVETQAPHPAPVIVVEEIPPPPDQAPPTSPDDSPPTPETYPPEVKKMQTSSRAERVRVSRRPSNGALAPVHAPRLIPGRFITSTEPTVDPIPAAYDLVEPMQYLFVRVVRARGLRAGERPFVKIRSGSHTMRSRPAHDGSGNPEWNQVFALSQSKPDSTLEISVWDGGAGESFLGGVCFDLSDVPVREKPDGPLAPQWYRLEGGDDRHVAGDIMVAVWLGTQADDSFPESCNSDAPYLSYTRSKVYQSPKLWYLRATVMEAQDLRLATAAAGSPVDIRVKIQAGFQSARTRRSASNSNSSSFSWLEDLMFVVSEPLDDHLIVLVEDRSAKEPVLLGHVTVPVIAIEQRLDERQLLPSKWFNLEGCNAAGGGNGHGAYSGRIHLRLCLEAGYHVLDEAAHVSSDFRPTAKQLWQPAVGVLELGILGARGLQPMKTKGGGKGATDAYCAAKYGKKWVRTRTITDSFDPRWNEQYTWTVYDPCTVLTIGVFDNWRMFADAGEDKPDYRIGKVRIRVSTLESNRIYTQSYPLLVLLKSGLKKMGEVQVAVRFASSALLPDTCALYATPMLPRMHYLRPIGVAQQEALRGAAIRTVAAWLARSEPPLGPEVVRYMLDADTHSWSLRRSKANWFRIMAVIAWAVGLARWVDDVRRWRNPVTTVLVHLLYLVLVWYPELAAPTATLYVFLIGAWYYRFRPRGPPGMDPRLSQADAAEADELDEEFDGVPSGRPPETVRARYDRLRALAARVQTVMGDLAAQGERLQALVSWRDPRATRVFVGVCLAVSVVLYVVPPKMVAVALGFYFLRHPMFRDPMPPAGLNFFRRLPSLSDRLL